MPTAYILMAIRRLIMLQHRSILAFDLQAVRRGSRQVIILLSSFETYGWEAEEQSLK